jgi:hypothetical protein
MVMPWTVYLLPQAEAEADPRGFKRAVAAAEARMEGMEY